MSFTVIIPARYASTRLPGKPLLTVGEEPMIQHVWRRAGESDALRVVIATDDERVFAVCEDFGAEVCMTSAEHESGTDRLQEVAEQLELPGDEIIVNVQGDEPLIPPEVINQVAVNLAGHAGAGIATLVEPIEHPRVVFDPNVVKVVVDDSGYALYFSRAPIPWSRDHFSDEGGHVLPKGMPYWRHIGIYAYRVSFLHEFVEWPPGRLETCERLEQLRALEQGVRIHVAPAEVAVPAGVDTREQLEAVRRIVQGAAV